MYGLKKLSIHCCHKRKMKMTIGWGSKTMHTMECHVISQYFIDDLRRHENNTKQCCAMLRLVLVHIWNSRRLHVIEHVALKCLFNSCRETTFSLTIILPAECLVDSYQKESCSRAFLDMAHFFSAPCEVQRSTNLSAQFSPWESNLQSHGFVLGTNMHESIHVLHSSIYPSLPATLLPRRIHDSLRIKTEACTMTALAHTHMSWYHTA